MTRSPLTRSPPFVVTMSQSTEPSSEFQGIYDEFLVFALYRANDKALLRTILGDLLWFCVDELHAAPGLSQSRESHFKEMSTLIEELQAQFDENDKWCFHQPLHRNLNKAFCSCICHPNDSETHTVMLHGRDTLIKSDNGKLLQLIWDSLVRDSNDYET